MSTKTNIKITRKVTHYGGNYLFEGFSIPNCSEALLQKSTSISNLPIFSYKAFSLFSASSSGALVEKISGLRERNSLFQVDIICGWIPKRLDRSLRVSCSLIASMATCALNAALCFFLLVFIRVKLIILLNLPSGLNLREYYIITATPPIISDVKCFNKLSLNVLFNELFSNFSF